MTASLSAKAAAVRPKRVERDVQLNQLMGFKLAVRILAEAADTGREVVGMSGAGGTGSGKG